ncbi:MAG: hypothetical protein V3S03_08435 [Vicinamibacteria bacterium]
MYRIDTPNNVASPPTPASLGVEGFFDDGVAGGSDGTTVDADWLNMLQESILDLLDTEGIAHSKTLYTGITAAIASKIASEAANPPPATTSVLGIIELATDAELLAGTRVDLATVPLSFANLFNNNTSREGWVDWPGGDWRFVWMFAAANDGDTLTLPAGFATASYNLFVNGLEDFGTTIHDVRAVPVTATTFTVHFDSAENPLNLCAFAIGSPP